MNASLNIVSLSGSSAASASGGTGSATASGAGEGAGSSGFESLLTVLMGLLANQNGEATADGEALTTTPTTEGGETLVDQSSILELLAMLQNGGLVDPDSLEDIDLDALKNAGTDTDSDGTDPLAAVLDLLIATLQSGTTTRSETGVSLDGASGDTLKALDALLARLTEDAGASGAAKPLSSEVIDKLKTLDQMLSTSDADPQLAELKSRIGDLLGTASSSDAKKGAGDATAPSVAALLGQTGTKDGSQQTSQRDVMAHVLDGAKGSAQADPTASDDAGQNGAQNQKSQGEANARQPAQSSAGFAAQVAGEAGDNAKSGDTKSDALLALTGQGAEKAQQAQARVIPTAYAQNQSRIDIPQVAFEIARHVSQGVNSFQIRLDPPEMGRIDVRIDIDKTGAMNAKLTVDRAETLDLLQRDARALERALGQAGLDNSKTNLEFSLRQNPFSQQNFNQGQGQNQNLSGWQAEAEDAGLETEISTPPPVAVYRGAIRPGGINLVA